MENEIDDELMDEATALALSVFGRQAGIEHIEAVYDALSIVKDFGTPGYRAVTLH